MGRGSVLSVIFLCLSSLLIAAPVVPVFAQTSDNTTATLRAIHADGSKHLSTEQVIALAGLSVGSAVGKQDLQAAADRLVQTGLFSSVNYAFQSK